MFDFIAYPLGQFLYFIYNTLAFHNYGLAILIFTVIIRLLLLPLTFKQYRSTAKMQLIQPKIQEIQKRYKNDKEKLNQEMMRVYQENKVNPAGGCLPLIIQMPILFSLYYDIVSPLKYMLGKTKEQIQSLVDIVSKALGVDALQLGFQKEISVIEYFNQFPGKLSGLENLLRQEELINMNFLGLNLGKTPTIDTAKLFGAESAIYLPLLLIPLLAVVFTYISAKLSMPPKPAGKSDGKPGGGMQSTMLLIGPVMTLIFSFSLPAGVGLYWIAGSVVQMFQQMYINKHIYLKKADTKEDVKPNGESEGQPERNDRPAIAIGSKSGAGAKPGGRPGGKPRNKPGSKSGGKKN